MTAFEVVLRSCLPRPVMDPAAAEALLARIQRARRWPTLVDRLEPPARRRLRYVGSAVVGAAALALGAALGWRRARVQRTRAA